jgi:hypothetical protein
MILNEKDLILINSITKRFNNILADEITKSICDGVMIKEQSSKRIYLTDVENKIRIKIDDWIKEMKALNSEVSDALQKPKTND